MLPEKLPRGDELWDIYSEKAHSALKNTFAQVRKGLDLMPLLDFPSDTTQFQLQLVTEHMGTLAEHEFDLTAYGVAYRSFMTDEVNNNRDQLSLLDRVASNLTEEKADGK
jgi:hypothetical protein